MANVFYYSLIEVFFSTYFFESVQACLVIVWNYQSTKSNGLFVNENSQNI